jgi:hypothetical protein
LSGTLPRGSDPHMTAPARWWMDVRVGPTDYAATVRSSQDERNGGSRTEEAQPRGSLRDRLESARTRPTHSHRLLQPWRPSRSIDARIDLPPQERRHRHAPPHSFAERALGGIAADACVAVARVLASNPPRRERQPTSARSLPRSKTALSRFIRTGPGCVRAVPDRPGCQPRPMIRRHGPHRDGEGTGGTPAGGGGAGGRYPVSRRPERAVRATRHSPRRGSPLRGRSPHVFFFFCRQSDTCREPSSQLKVGAGPHTAATGHPEVVLGRQSASPTRERTISKQSSRACAGRCDRAVVVARRHRLGYRPSDRSRFDGRDRGQVPG